VLTERSSDSSVFDAEMDNINIETRSQKPSSTHTIQSREHQCYASKSLLRDHVFRSNWLSSYRQNPPNCKQGQSYGPINSPEMTPPVHRRRRSLRPTTARTIIGHLIRIGRDLKHRAIKIADIVVIDEQKIRRPIPHTRAIERAPLQTAVDIRCRIRLIEDEGVGHEDADAGKGDVDVEVVIGHVHAVLAGQCAGPFRGRAIGHAGEVAVGGGEGRFEHLAEFVEEPGDRVLVGFVIEHDDGAGVGEDHFLERGPVGDAHGDLGRRVDVVDEAGSGDWVDVLVWGDDVLVAHENGDDVVGVASEPGSYSLEIGLKGAGVEDVAGAVAEEDVLFLFVPVSLELEHSNAVL
jgi:hypothetical protein